jgi:hypothetical protein
MGSGTINRSSQEHEPTPDTKYHARRREDMRTRIKQYGFYTVATEPAPAVLCTQCARDLTGSVNWIKMNGDPICGECLASARN